MDCPITGRGDESSHVSGIHVPRLFPSCSFLFFYPRRRKVPLKTDNEATSRVEKKGNSLYDVYARCSIISYTKLVNRRDLRTPIRFMRLHNVARRDSEIAHPGGAFAFNERGTVYEARVLSSRAENISLPLILLMLRSSAMMNARLKITNGIKIEVACESSSCLHFSTILIMHVAIIISMKMSVLIKAISMLDYTTFTRTAVLVHRIQLLINYVGKCKTRVSPHFTLFLPSEKMSEKRGYSIKSTSIIT